MRRLLFLLWLLSGTALAQKGGVKGKLTDEVTGEGLIGATISAGSTKAVATDVDGNFELKLEDGDYTIKITYVGYEPIEKTVSIKGKFIEINAPLKTKTLREVEIVADIAVARKTPVAFTNITPLKIQEQLGNQDLAMVLNTTPGVYATQRGGGDGDARISIRGFNSQNVLVLLDGIPMNDMYNGRVFWSNWFGLDNQTKTMQVQRGLGSSRLAIPAIGGTVNILTSGIEQSRRFVLKQEMGNNNNIRTTASFNSGILKWNWAISGAVSYGKNDGWVDNLYSERFFYFLKVEKRINKHHISFTGFGAPQVSGQRDFRISTPVNTYSLTEAQKLGIDTTGKTKLSYDRRYNPSWGYLRRRNGDGGPEIERYNTNINQFHKPVLAIKDMIQLNEKFNWSNTAYASFGNGGGTQLHDGFNSRVMGNARGELDLQSLYNTNSRNFQLNDPWMAKDSLRRASDFVRKNYNEHSWYGVLSTFIYQPNNHLDISGGFDARYYQGRVYSKVEDLLGADYAALNGSQNDPSNVGKKEGDVIIQNIRRHIGWGGVFGTAEYKGGWWTAFINASGSVNSYQQVNYFLPKVLDLGDTTLNIGYNTKINYKGKEYNRETEGLQTNKTPQKILSGYVVKGGMNFNITEKQNVFFNLGTFSRAPLMSFVFNSGNIEFDNIKNEEIRSVELGYNLRSQFFSANINAYYTRWINRPTTVSVNIQGDNFPSFVSGIGALHKGIELDFVVKPNDWFSWEGSVSLGDWRWTGTGTAVALDLDGNELGRVQFKPDGVKVGDAAQFSYATSMRIEPLKNFYIKPQFNYFSRNYANFNPEVYTITDLSSGFGPNLGRQAWRLPDYYFLDMNVGYSVFVKNHKYDFRFTMLNVLDDFYITDANDNALSQTFSAQSASVNVGMGRRWQFSITGTF
ncbi:MAG: TonB-dependent receptor [Bacteroidota bacterium]|jgi:iron complex outermembrane receptor protein